MRGKDTSSSSEKTVVPSDSEGLKDTNYSYKIADLALKILALTKDHPPLPGTQDGVLTKGSWNARFEAARLQAQKLLNDIENREGIVDAYQIFEEGRLLSLEEIAGIFNRAGWKGVASKAPVTKLMQSMEKNFKLHKEQLESLQPEKVRKICKRTSKNLENLFCKLDEELQAVGPFPDFSLHCNKFIGDLMGSGTRSSLTEFLGEMMWFDRLYNWCFETNQQGRKKRVHLYRPNEIFRFAVFYRWEDERLTRKLSSLCTNPAPRIPRKQLNRFTVFESESQDISD